MKSGDKDRDRESERILNRISLESDGGSTLFQRTAKRARDHVSARDADADDPIEMWGTRIGRVLGLVLLAGLVIYLILFVTGG